MRIAYLIAAHGNYQHLQRLIDALQDEDVFFYIHIDRKAALPVISGDRIEYIRPRVDVHWSGFSQVTATLLLMEAAVKDGHDYYAYISGVDYPIKPNHWLKELLAAGGEYIHIHRMGEDPLPRCRGTNIIILPTITTGGIRPVTGPGSLPGCKKLRSFHVSKQIPFPLFYGRFVVCVVKNAVGHILKESALAAGMYLFSSGDFVPMRHFFKRSLVTAVLPAK